MKPKSTKPQPHELIRHRRLAIIAGNIAIVTISLLIIHGCIKLHP